MNIHREGRAIISNYIIFSLVAIIALFIIGANLFWFLPMMTVLTFGLFFLLIFFRNPDRPIPNANNALIYAPADGKIVAIEEVYEGEVLHQKCIQVSIFMSLSNVHVNRYPLSGKITYFKHHQGRYLVAWHPKSSTENERTSTVITTKIATKKTQILVRQIAGAVARRIVNYSTEGDQVQQGNDMGFIKFGSRVDIFCPASAAIQVKIGDQVEGNTRVIARLAEGQQVQ